MNNLNRVERARIEIDVLNRQELSDSEKKSILHILLGNYIDCSHPGDNWFDPEKIYHQIDKITKQWRH